MAPVHNLRSASGVKPPVKAVSSSSALVKKFSTKIVRSKPAPPPPPVQVEPEVDAGPYDFDELETDWILGVEWECPAYVMYEDPDFQQPSRQSSPRQVGVRSTPPPSFSAPVPSVPATVPTPTAFPESYVMPFDSCVPLNTHKSQEPVRNPELIAIIKDREHMKKLWRLAFSYLLSPRDILRGPPIRASLGPPAAAATVPAAPVAAPLPGSNPCISQYNVCFRSSK
jgi:hypothetical protein